jgi:GT2 family glycosyltransferase
MQLSVVIPTYNRPTYARDTVYRLLPQLEAVGAECIVVDQSDNEMAKRLHADLRPLRCVRVLRLEEPSLAGARNLGIQQARGSVLLFLDDDIVPGPELLAAHLAAYRDETIGCVAGRIIEAVPGRNRNTHRVGSWVTWLGRVYRNFDHEGRAEVCAPAGGNMSFSARALADTGPFDTNYSGNAALEETDYGYRLRRAGYRIVFEPAASLLHLAAPAGGCRISDVLAMERSNFRNLTRFYLRHKGWIPFPLFLAANTVVFVKRTRRHCGVLRAIRGYFAAVGQGIESHIRGPL